MKRLTAVVVLLMVLAITANAYTVGKVKFALGKGWTAMCFVGSGPVFIQAIAPVSHGNWFSLGIGPDFSIGKVSVQAPISWNISLDSNSMNLDGWAVNAYLTTKVKPFEIQSQNTLSFDLTSFSTKDFMLLWTNGWAIGPEIRYDKKFKLGVQNQFKLGKVTNENYLSLDGKTFETSLKIVW